MPTESKDQLTDHAYDDIKEYDNPIPGWWTWLFIATIAFSAMYTFVNFLAPESTPQAAFEVAMMELTRKQYGDIAGMEPNDATLAALKSDPKWTAVGRTLFTTHCVSCHGSEGQGGTGSNLTDEPYVHVQRLSDIIDVIANGRNAGAMPALRTQLSKPELLVVSAYVASLRGVNRPGRAAEGTVPPPWSDR